MSSTPGRRTTAVVQVPVAKRARRVLRVSRSGTERRRARRARHGDVLYPAVREAARRREARVVRVRRRAVEGCDGDVALARAVAVLVAVAVAV